MKTAEQIRLRFHYDSLTGELTWRVNWGRMKAGDVAGSVRPDGYRQVKIDNKLYLVSRVIWLWMEGSWPSGVVDHKDRNPTNNRWENLRDTTQSVNLHNSSLRSDNSTGVCGVGWHKLGKKWQAKIKLNGKTKSLGLFSSFDEAVAARHKAEMELFQ